MCKKIIALLQFTKIQQQLQFWQLQPVDAFGILEFSHYVLQKIVQDNF